MPHRTGCDCEGRSISNAVRRMSFQLAQFFSNPGLRCDDYASLFLTYLGEKLGARLPQGLLRGYQSVYVQPVQVMTMGLNSLVIVLRQKRPTFSDQDLADDINWLLTLRYGYIGRRTARIASGLPYNGKVVRLDMSEQ